MKKIKAFTLIEVLIALMISAIVASIAYPSYLSFMMESRRQDAISAIMQNQQLVENYMLASTSGNILTIAQAQTAGFSLLSNKGYYALTYCVDNAGTPTLYYIVATANPAGSGGLGTCINITAQALTSSMQSNDTGCVTITAHSKFSGTYPAVCK